MHLPEPDLPPLLSSHPLNAPERPFETACKGARAGRYEAGDLIWARDVSRLDCALVLEPDVPIERTTEMLLTAMVAIGDAIGMVAPPEVGIHYNWPQSITANGAKVGRARFAVSGRLDEERAPSWLVIGMEIAIADRQIGDDPGLSVDKTALWEEGCGDVDCTSLLNAYARHFLSWIDTWDAEGFKPIHQAWLGRCSDTDNEIAIESPSGVISGAFVGLDDSGGAIIRTEGGMTLVPLIEGVSPEAIEIASL